jgi:type I site-specific restriction endonuclease
MSDLVGKVERKARRSWITQEMISKMDERRKWKNVNNEEGRKNYRRLRQRIEECHGQRQEGISGEHMRRDHRISKNTML